MPGGRPRYTAGDLSATLVARTPYFNATFYAAVTGRRFADRMEAALHYMNEGASAGAAPHPAFHLRWYRSEHPYLADTDPLLHFLALDLRRRSPHPLFDPQWYLDRYPDIDPDGDPFLHFVDRGAAELRDPGPSFSTRAYVAAHPGLDPARVNPLVHYHRRRGEAGFRPWARLSAAGGTRHWQAGQRDAVTVRIENAGDTRWEADGTALLVAGRWLSATRRIPSGVRRARIPETLGPGQTCELRWPVQVPWESERYILELCVVAADGPWPDEGDEEGVLRLPVLVRARRPAPPTSRGATVRSAGQAARTDAQLRAATAGRPFTAGTRPVIRWIKGDGLDDAVTRSAIALATRLFGDAVDYCLCTNGIAASRARGLLAHAEQPVELWPVDAADNPWLARRILAAGCYADRFGYWWKWFPERVRPDAPEWILDGDMVLTGIPDWFADWAAGRDPLRLSQDDGARRNEAYGRYADRVDPTLAFYSGLASLPPGYRFRAAFERALEDPGLRPPHDGRREPDEQGVVAVAFRADGALPIPLHEFPFARAFERALDYGPGGDRGRVWGYHFGGSFRARNRHYERLVADGAIPGCEREPAVLQRFRWLANRGQWGEPGISLPESTVGRIAQAASTLAGRPALDIGTSRGRVAATLAAVGCRVTTIDMADRGAAANLAGMGIEIVVGDCIDFLRRDDRRWPMIAVDLHGNDVGMWRVLWPLLTAAVAPGGHLAVANTDLWRSPAWSDQRGPHEALARGLPGWRIERFPDPLPGLAICTRED
ncbi:MAG: hypothetical protein AB7P02_16955 [Alphaproteobacteria bacterium]